MALLKIDQNPTITDTILFDLFTTDDSGVAITPYKVNAVTIYFIERNYVSSNLEEFDLDISGFQSTFNYKNAAPIQVFGSDDFPAWLSSDTADAFLTQVLFDENNNPEVGHFQLEWTPSQNTNTREGDYFLCYTWTPIPAGTSLSTLFYFNIGGAFLAPTIPSQQTNPIKYPTLLSRYTPSMFKQFLSAADVTPTVIEKTNLAVADGFTEIENLSNQLVNLWDANLVKETFLPYLANMFKWKLRSGDPTLWRKQVGNAISMYKQKGTLKGLREALKNSGVDFKKITYYWQIISNFTWQEAFIVTNQTQFCLSKKALLPVESDNFHIFYRANGTLNYVEVPLNYVQFVTTSSTNENCENNSVNTTCVNWVTNIITLQAGDVVRILYKVAEPVDQQLENYIQTLDLADQRDEITVTFPSKNWNVRLIAEDDILFPVIVPVKHPFAYASVYGRKRTEFPYSEQIYNMEEYNGSTRDSTDPCDLDYTFSDVCTACRSSKISIDVSIEELSSDRIEEVEEVIKDFIPFHAVLHSINYVGLTDEFIPPPIEELECLIQCNLEDNIAFSQFDFDRIIIDGLNPGNITRDMLSNATTVAVGTDGTGVNLAYTIFSPGIDFGEIGINDTNNLLEILSGTNQGEYSLLDPPSPVADVVGITQYPLDHAGFPFRFSNIQYEEMSVSVYQENFVTFTDSDIDFSLFPIPDEDVWVINVTSGSNIGTYSINRVLPNNTLVLTGWTAGADSGFTYDLNAPGNINVASGISGIVSVSQRGKVQTQVLDHFNVQKGDYVLFGGQQYPLIYIDKQLPSPTNDYLHIEGYSGGDQIGSVNIKILRRLVDNAVGYLNFRGMQLQTVSDYEVTLGIQNGQNPLSPMVENSDFKENYLILIGSTYYAMADIDGQSITLNGPVLDWGTLGQTTMVSYTIIQLVNMPISVQSGYDEQYRTFDFVDRRGDVVFMEEQTLTIGFKLAMLNNPDSISETVRAKEKIWCTVTEQ
jgi:phage tail P2-like protein